MGHLRAVAVGIVVSAISWAATVDAAPVTLTHAGNLVVDLPAGWAVRAAAHGGADLQQIYRVTPATPDLAIIVVDSSTTCAANVAEERGGGDFTFTSRPAWAPLDLDPTAGIVDDGTSALVQLCRDVSGRTLLILINFDGHATDPDVASAAPIVDAIDRAFAIAAAPAPAPPPTSSGLVTLPLTGLTFVMPAQWFTADLEAGIANPDHLDAARYLGDLDLHLLAFFAVVPGGGCSATAPPGMTQDRTLPDGMYGFVGPGKEVVCFDSAYGSRAVILSFAAAQATAAIEAALPLLRAVRASPDPGAAAIAPAVAPIYVPPPPTTTASSTSAAYEIPAGRVRGRAWYALMGGALQQQPEGHDATLGVIARLDGTGTTLGYRNGIGVGFVAGAMLGWDLTSRTEYDAHAGIGGAARLGNLFVVPALVVGVDGQRGDAARTSYARSAGGYLGVDVDVRAQLGGKLGVELAAGASNHGNHVRGGLYFPRARGYDGKARGGFCFAIERDDFPRMKATGVILGVTY